MSSEASDESRVSSGANSVSAAPSGGLETALVVPVAAVQTPPAPRAHPGATFALVVLTFVNMFNYVDRYVPSAVKEQFKKDLKLNDVQTSLPLSAFVLVYMAASPVFGFLTERGWKPKRLIAAGVLLWSLATAGGALAANFWTFMLARALVGVGEAAYATIAPALLSDFYPGSQRNKKLSIFFLALPFGGAMGYVLGGQIGEALGWRIALLVCGLPGVVLAALVMCIKEPPPGATEGDLAAVELSELSFCESAMLLPRNPHYVFSVLGLIFVSFGAGGLADWFPTYLERVYGFKQGTAGVVIGASAACGGIFGTGLGAVVGDLAKGKVRNPYLFISAIGLGGSGALLFLVLIMPNSKALLVCLIFLLQILLWLYNGPVNALMCNCVAPNLRTRAFSFSIFLLHALGDAISPSIIGALSDSSKSIAKAVIIVPFALCVGGVLWGIGWWVLPTLPQELAKPLAAVEAPVSDPLSRSRGSSAEAEAIAAAAAAGSGSIPLVPIAEDGGSNSEPNAAALGVPADSSTNSLIAPLELHPRPTTSAITSKRPSIVVVQDIVHEVVQELELEAGATLQRDTAILRATHATHNNNNNNNNNGGSGGNSGQHSGHSGHSGHNGQHKHNGHQDAVLDTDPVTTTIVPNSS